MSMHDDRPHYGPSPSRRKKIDELWWGIGEDSRADAAAVFTQETQGIIAPDGTIAGSALPISTATPAAETFGSAGTPGATQTASDAGHVHPMPADPVPAGVAALFLAKGDILVGTGPGTYARLPAPTTAGSTLVSDPATATGLRWAPDAVATASLLTLTASLRAPSVTAVHGATVTPSLLTLATTLPSPTVSVRATVRPAMVTLAVSLSNASP